MKQAAFVTLPAAIGRGALDRLGEDLDAAEESPVVVLQGETSTEIFCKGLHLESLSDTSESELHESLGAYADLLCRMLSYPRPLVAWVNGQATGGGVGIAAACDSVLCLPSSTFGLPEGIFGFLPAMVLPVMTRRCSRSSVARMALRGEGISAAESLMIGLTDQIVDASRSEAALKRECRLLGRIHPNAVKVLKGSLLDVEHDIQAIRQGCDRTRQMLSKPEVRARIHAFVQDGIAPWESTHA